MTMLLKFTDAQIAEEIVRLVEARGCEKSICPSEVARALLSEGAASPPAGAPNGETEVKWQSLMGSVRQVAIGLAREGRIDILRKGHPIEPPSDPAALKGVIRLRRR